jgi:putative transcriptional regulator
MTTSRTERPKQTAKQPRHFRGETPLGRQLIAGMRDVARHIRGEIDLPSRTVVVPERVDVKAIREASGLSQSEFASRYGISERSLQEWEQSRRQPEGAVRAYLTVISRIPKAVHEALKR